MHLLSGCLLHTHWPDLCWRVVWFYTAHHLSVPDISQQLSISERTVRRYIDMFEQTSEVEPRKQHHGPPKLLGDFEQLVLLKIICECICMR